MSVRDAITHSGQQNYSALSRLFFTSIGDITAIIQPGVNQFASFVSLLAGKAKGGSLELNIKYSSSYNFRSCTSITQSICFVARLTKISGFTHRRSQFK